MNNLSLVSFVWIAFSSFGLYYAFNIVRKARIAYIDVRAYRGDDARGILYQARLNQTLAFIMLAKHSMYLMVGIYSLFMVPGDRLPVLIVQGVFILGNILAVMLTRKLDKGWQELQDIVQGRRASDKTSESIGEINVTAEVVNIESAVKEDNNGAQVGSTDSERRI